MSFDLDSGRIMVWLKIENNGLYCVVVSAVYYYYTCLYLYICRSGTYQWWGKAIFVCTHTRLCWWSASQQTRILCGMFTCFLSWFTWSLFSFVSFQHSLFTLFPLNHYNFLVVKVIHIGQVHSITNLSVSV